MKKYYSGLDFLKFLLAIFIVAAHTKLFQEYPLTKVLLDRLISIAVPLFFSISAFFFTRKIDAIDNEAGKQAYFLKTIKRLGILFCLWYCLMLPMTWFKWWSIATVKETFYAILFSCTFNGYWFIKALIINTAILFAFRDRKATLFLLLCSIAIYLFWAYNYRYHFISLNISPYYSFFYHTSYFCVGALMARYYEVIRLFRFKSLSLITIWAILFILTSYLPIDPLYRLFSTVLIFPIFERLEIDYSGLKTMRSMSIILYMIQFVLIWLYNGACKKWLQPESIQYSVLQYSITRFFVVTAVAIAVAWIIVSLEKIPRLSFLKHLH